jgi:hypothetical protein
VVDAGGGMNLIYAGKGQDSFALSAAGGGVDRIFGFTLAGHDVLDLRQTLLADDWDGQLASLPSLLSTLAQHGGTWFYAAPGAGQPKVALAMLAGVTTDLQGLLAHGALRLS